MGLFDKFKKKNVQEVPVEEVKAQEPVAAEEKPEQVESSVSETIEVQFEASTSERETEKTEEKFEEAQVTQSQAPTIQPQVKQNEPQIAEVANDGRRFTLLVENAKQLTEEEGIMIAGMLYGNLQLGDEVYMLLPNHAMRIATIDGIEIAAGQNADSAENQKVVLQFKEIKDINQVPRYTVITSIRPQDKPSVDTTIENPHLLGLSMDYPRLNKDPLYMNLLVFELCHAYFLVPARVAANPVQNGDGTSTFEQDTQVRFPGIPDPSDSNKSVFTIFTDWLALANWKNLFDETHPPKAIIMRFPDVVNVSAGNGVMLNPFGPTSIFLPGEVIKKITELEGYKQEFESNKE